MRSLLEDAIERVKFPKGAEEKAEPAKPLKPKVKRHDVRHLRTGRFISVRNGRVRG